MKRTSKKPSNLSESLQRRLNSYALAASAAGVGVLALVQPAEGKIVYTKAYHHIPRNAAITLDLNHDGIPDFTIYNYYSGGCSRYGQVSVGPLGNNAVRGYWRTSRSGFKWYYASALRPGDTIHPGASFLTKKLKMARSENNCSGSTFQIGQWFNVKGRYLGLAFSILGETHYGWARLQVWCKHKHCHALLTGYAYETIPNKPIIAGKTHGKDVIIVQPDSLGALAAGAARRGAQ